MEETILTKTLGNTPKIKVLGFLIESRDIDHSISDISQGAGIGRTTLFRIWNDLISLGIIKYTRNIGNAKLYKLNIENEFVGKMVELFDNLVVVPVKDEEDVLDDEEN